MNYWERYQQKYGDEAFIKFSEAVQKVAEMSGDSPDKIAKAYGYSDQNITDEDMAQLYGPAKEPSYVLPNEPQIANHSPEEMASNPTQLSVPNPDTLANRVQPFNKSMIKVHQKPQNYVEEMKLAGATEEELYTDLGLDDSTWRFSETRDTVLGDLGFSPEFIKSKQYLEEGGEDTMPYISPFDFYVGGSKPGKSILKQTFKAKRFTGNKIKRITNAITDPVAMPTHIKRFFQSLDGEDYADFQHFIKYAEEQGLILSDFMIKGSTENKLTDYMLKAPLHHVKELFESQDKLTANYFKSLINIFADLKNKGLKIDNMRWQDIKPLESAIQKEIKNLREVFYSVEDDLYKIVDKNIPKGKTYMVKDLFSGIEKEMVEEGIPVQAINKVHTVLNRFNKIYKEDVKEIAKRRSLKGKKAFRIKSLKAKIDKELKIGTPKSEARAQRMNDTVENLREEIKILDKEMSEFKDTRYLTANNLNDTIKLTRRPRFKRGEALSVNDEDEMRGLQIAEKRLKEFFVENASTPELKEALTTAYKATRSRSNLFGPKDSGGSRHWLAKALKDENFEIIHSALTKPEYAKDNLAYIRQYVGKNPISKGTDTETTPIYKTALNVYLRNKLGLEPAKKTTLLDAGKVFDSTDRVSIQKMAAALQSLDADDFNLMKGAMSTKSIQDLKALRKFAGSFATMDSATKEYGRGITSGVWPYLKEGNKLKAPLRLTKYLADSVLYYSDKALKLETQAKPFLKSFTGSAIGAGTYLLATDAEDYNIEDFLKVLVFGGIAGQYVGKALRSILEDDIVKVSRYLKHGYNKPLNTKTWTSIKRLDKVLGSFEDDAIKAAGQSKLVQGTVGAATVGAGYKALDEETDIIDEIDNLIGSGK